MTFKKPATGLPTRGPTHVTDTRAVRVVLGQLDDNWLVRSLEERDYGIDLQLELFNGPNATGRIIFVQVKGTEHAFSNGGDEKLSFPTQTIRYAKLFNAPFFLFYVSNESKEVRFVWLQKYAETRLRRDSPKWLTRGKVNVILPSENVLANNKGKITEIADKQARETTGLEFLRVESNLVLHAESVLCGEFRVGQFCSTEALKLFEFTEFFREYVNPTNVDKFDNLAELPGVFQAIADTGAATQPQMALVRACLELIAEVKVSFLNTPDLDAFSEEHGSVYPY